MTALLGGAALLCTALGLVCAAAGLARTRELSQALPVLLELLTAAGLLRLTAEATWQALATAAVIVGVRTLVVRYGLCPASRTDGAGWSSVAREPSRPPRPAAAAQRSRSPPRTPAISSGSRSDPLVSTLKSPVVSRTTAVTCSSRRTPAERNCPYSSSRLIRA